MSTKFFARLATAMEKGRETELERQSRRVWLQNFGTIAASSAVLWACGNEGEDKAKASKRGMTAEGESGDAADPMAEAKADAEIVKVAMGLEQEAIALYTAAAGLDIW